MRGLAILSVLAAVSIACGQRSQSGVPSERRENIAAAERLVDAFYSFDPARLREQLRLAEGSAPPVLYYQGWAKGGNYRVRDRRPCIAESEDTVRCAITVEDDLIKALGLGFHVTDTFRITVADGTVREVRNSSNDPPLFAEALAWVRRERADEFRGGCAGFFAGGPTPEACVRVVVQGFAAYAALRGPPP
jgi:hypothetical protein